MTTQQPEALRLADDLDAEFAQGRISNHTGRKAATELRRQHSENETLQAGYAAARLEIESLQARIKTMAEEHADELMVAHLDGRMRAAQPAGAQQPGTAYVVPEVLDALNWVDDFIARCNGDDRGACESVNVLRRAFASHGQAPAQAAPAAVVGTSDVVSIQRQAFIRGWDERGMAHQLKGTVETDERMRALMDAYFPRTAAPTTQPTPQQEAQEPVAWYVTGGDRLLDEDEAKAEARHIGGTARAIPLYTAPQPSPASQGDALDAARYAIVRRGQHWSVIDGLGDPLTGDRLDAAVDAVCAAQEGKK